MTIEEMRGNGGIMFWFSAGRGIRFCYLLSFDIWGKMEQGPISRLDFIFPKIYVHIYKIDVSMRCILVPKKEIEVY